VEGRIYGILVDVVVNLFTVIVLLSVLRVLVVVKMKSVWNLVLFVKMVVLPRGGMANKNAVVIGFVNNLI